MRSLEHMAHAIYLADCKYDLIGTPGSSVQPYAWDDLHEEQQEDYKRHASAVLEHLFEHGRISSYISQEQLEKLSAEYRAYLESKSGKRQEEGTEGKEKEPGHGSFHAAEKCGSSISSGVRYPTE